MSREGSTGNLAETGNDIDNTRREASFLHECGSDKSRKRCLLGRLKDNGVAASYGGANLPCPHKQREIPGNDLGADADLTIN